jgi:hypothetical protein
MTACIICMNDAFNGLSMHDKDHLARVARDVLQGMFSILNNKDSFKSFQPARRGTCVVERCAQTIEAVCGSCQKLDCQRCLIAAELRAAEDRNQ